MCYTVQNSFIFYPETMISSGRFQCHMGFRFACVSLASSALIFALSALFLSFRYIAMIFFKKVGFWDIPCFCLAFFPRLILLSISVGFIIGLTWYYTILFRRGYWVVMSSFGVRPTFFLRPILRVVFLTSSLLSVLSLSWFPSLVEYGKSAERAVRHRVDVDFFVPRIFFQWDNACFYAHEKKADGQFKGVFFVDDREPHREKIFLSRSADAHSKEGGFFSLLKDGHSIFLDEHSRTSFLSFSEYKAFFPAGNGQISEKKKAFVQGMPSSDLWGGGIENQKELCRRIILPCLSLISAYLFYNVVWILGDKFLWLAVVGSVMLCGVVWATSSSYSTFVFLLFALALRAVFLPARCRI